MTQLEALQELLVKVKAGKLQRFAPEFERAFYPIRNNMTDVYQSNDAFTGSMDAALSLFEAVLPGWDWCLSSNGCDVWPEDNPSALLLCIHSNPARAMLIATIKALIAKLEAE